MKTWMAAVVVASALAVAGCAAPGPQIRTDYDASADFSRYATFAFMERDGVGYQTLSDQRVIAAVTRELEARGYRRVVAGADLLVNFSVVSEEIQEVRTVPSAVVPPPWYGWRGGYYYPWPAYTHETWVDRYQRGSLFIDLVDAQRQQLVWEGQAASRVTRAAREDPAGAIDRAVTEVFARYPFQAGPQR